MIKLIWAQTTEGIIALNNHLPWKIPDEMRHFQQTTWQQNILMGRKTFESLAFKPLKNRFNYVLTHQKIHSALGPLKNLIFIDNINQVLERFQQKANSDLYVIGGNQVFNTFFPYADELIISTIYHNYPGDLKISSFNFQDFQIKKTLKKPEFEINYWERIKPHG